MRWPRYLALKDSGVSWLGEVPAHWTLKRLKRLVQVSGGMTPDRSNPAFWDGDIPWVTAKDMKVPRISDSEDRVTSEALTATGLRLLQPPVTLIVVRGMILAHTFPVCEAEAAVTINQDMKALRPLGEVDERYLAWMLRGAATFVLSLADESAHGTKALRTDRLFETDVPLPPIDEQRGIAAFLDRETARIDALVAAKRRLIALLHEKRAALIARAVTRGLDADAPTKDSGVAWLGRVPAHWQVAPLKRRLHWITSGSRGWAEHYADDGDPFIRIGNLTRDRIELDLSDVQHVAPPSGAEGERTLAAPGDLVVSITAYLGSVAVVPPNLTRGYVSQHVALARPIHELVDARWLAYCVLSRPGQQQLQAAGYGGTKVQLGLEDVLGVVVALPPKSEQALLSDRLDQETQALSSAIDKVEEAVTRLTEYRSTLITSAITGRIDVRAAA